MPEQFDGASALPLNAAASAARIRAPPPRCVEPCRDGAERQVVARQHGGCIGSKRTGSGGRRRSRGGRACGRFLRKWARTRVARAPAITGGRGTRRALSRCRRGARAKCRVAEVGLRRLARRPRSVRPMLASGDSRNSAIVLWDRRPWGRRASGCAAAIARSWPRTAGRGSARWAGNEHLRPIRVPAGRRRAGADPAVAVGRGVDRAGAAPAQPRHDRRPGRASPSSR